MAKKEEPAGRIEGEFLVPAGADGLRPIFPTDVSRYISLNQCRRYLRLHLHRNSVGERFLRDAGVHAEPIRPLLTRSGREFELDVVAAIASRYEVHHFSPDGQGKSNRLDNDRVVALVRALPLSSVLVLAQPRLEAVVGDWRIRGDADLVRVERDVTGRFQMLIADIKSSAAAKVDHRLQVAFYHELLSTIFADAGLAPIAIATAILYRPAPEPSGQESPAELLQADIQQRAATELFNVSHGLLELVDDPEAYRRAVRELVTNQDSVAHQVIAQPFTAIPYHLAYKCEGCLYNEFCMKWSAERDDLSLLPHLDENEKAALLRSGTPTVAALSSLKVPARDEQTGKEDVKNLVSATGQEASVAKIGATWPVGPRLDELVHRSRAYRRFKGEPLRVPSTIPSKGYGSLPYVGPDHNPNLVRVYVDAQHDYLQDRVYLLGSLVVAAENGLPNLARRRSVVRLASGPPDTGAIERDLFRSWIDDTIRAIVELAAPDEEGRARAPIHLIFFDRYEQRMLLQGLGRHATTLLGATPLYDFVTQLAAFDSPVATFLDDEIKELKNYPMVCQSLQAVSAYLKFDWNAPTRFRDLFHERLFDFWGKLDDPPHPDASPWYTNRARFGSQIPLEYAYAAWDDLPPPTVGTPDDAAKYRAATPDLLVAFQARRLEAIEYVAAEFFGNKQTTKSVFDLPNLHNFEDRARSFADALDEFVIIERHVTLAGWKRARFAPPERRVLAGETLIARYLEADQAPGVAATMRENKDRRLLREEQRSAFKLANPNAAKITLPKEQRDASQWEDRHRGLPVRLRLETADIDASLGEILAITKLKQGDTVVLYDRWTEDSRLPLTERVPLQPTAKQLLYGGRARIASFRLEQNAAGVVTGAWVDLTLDAGGGGDARGFVFAAMPQPLAPNGLYTLDADPNDRAGSTQAIVTAGLRAGNLSPILDRLTGHTTEVSWPPLAKEGQRRFMAGLDELHRLGSLHDFEPSKREYIAQHGEAPTLLVQGPPGTGKSYSSAFALLARLQGAMAADLDERIGLSCKTHAATDVLVANLAATRLTLRALIDANPVVAEFFDPRLFAVPIYRVNPKQESAPGVIAVVEGASRPKEEPKVARRLLGERWAVLAGTPGGIYRIVKEHGGKEIFGHELFDTLVLDEASQMNLPEAAMAALSLRPTGRLIVVGDHRQMPPIIKHDWENEARRSFRDYRTFESLFTTLLPLGAPTIRFAESFRLHRDIAEFLRREIYHQDGIDYHSQRTELLTACPPGDPFVDAVLDPAHPLVVVVHDEAASQVRNPFEQRLILPILRTLAARGFDAEHGLGVVVPHRAQRAALQDAVPALTIRDPDTGAVILSAVDTIERFQGGERTAILVSATESDPGYLLQSAGFLLDPRRLTVALSRAKQKMILVAARSVFDLFSPDEDLFRDAQLWKNLRHRTCTVPLWRGEIEGVPVEVWGNAPSKPGSGEPLVFKEDAPAPAAQPG